MNDDVKAFHQSMEKEAEIARRKQALAEKKLDLDESKTDYQFEKFVEAKDEMQRAKLVNYAEPSQAYIEKIVKDNDEYMESARRPMMFINKDFVGTVPFFRKNLILMGAKTGDGKSTTVANIAFGVLSQKSEKTGTVQKALVITNEEVTEDVYNRITCLIKGWAYRDHDKFTDEQRAEFKRMIPILAAKGRLMVIDDKYEGIPGTTTTLEGIKQVLDKLLLEKIHYNVIIIDYYQNVKFSKQNPFMNEYEVQQAFAAILDQYKNSYPAPIVLMCQVDPTTEENRKPFEHRIKGRKVISDKATSTIEIIADRENMRTEWHVHKGRFSGAVGRSFFTGFDHGKYVPWDESFIRKVALIKEKRMEREILKNIKPGENKEVKKEDNNGNNNKSD